MAITRSKKESILKDLGEQIKKAQMVVFVNFHGLNTAATRKLRSLLRAGSNKYQVAKKTLIKKALENFKISGEEPRLEGETALIFGKEDAVGIAKSIFNFIREHKELSVLGGIFDRKYIEPEKISDFSRIPSREVLLSKLAYTVVSPLQRLVGAMQGNLRNFVNVISQIKK